MTFKKFLNEEISAKGHKLLQLSGNVIADQEICGDYEFYIIYNKMLKLYQIAMNHKDKDFTDLEQQAAKGDLTIGQFDRRQVKTLITKWLAEYGDLVVASHNPLKTEIYGKLFKATGFETRPFPLGGIVVIS